MRGRVVFLTWSLFSFQVYFLSQKRKVEQILLYLKHTYMMSNMLPPINNVDMLCLYVVVTTHVYVYCMVLVCMY